MILLDTSGILAALFPDQTHHREAARALSGAVSPRIVSPFVLAEADYLIQKYAGIDSELLFLREVSRGAYELASFSSSDVEEASDVIARYKNLQLGLADASIAVLANRYGVRDVLTLDERHFRAIRVGRKPFRLLPADS